MERDVTEQRDFEVITGDSKGLPSCISISLSVQLFLLNQNLHKLLDHLPFLSAKPLIVNGKMFCLADKQDLSKILGVSTATIQRWSKDGVIPKPFSPERSKKGRKILKWDIYEVLDWIQKYR